MSKPNQLRIGNENFKTWLKRLDPVERVEKMSAIAKTQAAAGLKGSLIKASLAQLSQRCHVMLMRLTDEEIEFNTRKPSGRELQCQGNKPEINSEELGVRIPQYSHATHHDNNANEHYHSTSNRRVEFGKTTFPPVPTIKRKLENKEYKKLLKRPKHDRLDTRYKELFGDCDDDDSDVMKIKVPKPFDTHTITKEHNVYNAVSATDNNDIYNSPSIAKNEHMETNKDKNESNITCSSRVRTDISLSEDGSNLAEGISLHKKKIKSKKCEISSKSRKRSTKIQNVSKCHKIIGDPKNEQINSDMLGVSPLHCDNSEDDPVKELWKIFGMESPTDRSENIIKSSYPQLSNLKDITNNENSIQNVLASKEQKNEVLTEQVTILNQDSSRDATTNKTVSERVGRKPVQPGNTKSDSNDKEPFCKIAETFSLASLNPGSLKDDGLPSHFITKGCRSVEKTKDNNELHENIESDLCYIETISLCDDEDDFISEPLSNNNNVKMTKEIVENQNKVGTIRVKNLGLLLDPQVVPEISHTTEINNSQLKRNDPISINQGNETRDAKERFFNSYRYYFDELLESKILKLGELLHLAVSDEIRRKERIKRAEQLSSSDLISEEIQRSNKDFNEMMKVRGSEFAPLVDLILKKFDQGSKLTLFFTLFIRIFERAQEIDSENSKHILSAKEVIKTMLSKVISTHKEISSPVFWDEQSFVEKLRVINLLLTELRTKSSSNNSIVGNGVVPPQKFMGNRSTDKSSHDVRINVVDTNKSNLEETTFTNNALERDITPPVQSANLGAHVHFQRRSTDTTDHNEIKTSGPTDGPMENSILMEKSIHQLEYSGSSGPLGLQQNKTTNNLEISQKLNSPITIKSILFLPTNEEKSRLTSDTSTINMTQQLVSNLNLLKHNHSSLQHRDNVLSRSTLHIYDNRSKEDNLSLQKARSERRPSNPEHTHSTVNRLGTEFNYIKAQQTKLPPPMSNDVLFHSPIWLERIPNTSLTLQTNPQPKGQTKPTDVRLNQRRQSVSKSTIKAPGMAPLVASFNKQQHPTYAHSSNSSVKIPLASYSSTVHNQPATNIKAYNSAKTSSLGTNDTTRIAPIKETQLEVRTTNPNQDGSNARRAVRYVNELIRSHGKPPNNQNMNSLTIQPSITFNNNCISTNNTTSMTNNLASGFSENKMYQIKPGEIETSEITIREQNGISVTKPINVNTLFSKKSLVETPGSSNLYANSKVVGPKREVQQYSSTNGHPTSEILNSMLRKSSLTVRPKYTSLKDNSSTNINLKNLLQSGGITSKHTSSPVPVSLSSNINNQDKGGTSIGHQQPFQIISNFPSTEPLSPPSVMEAIPMSNHSVSLRTATEPYYGNQSTENITMSEASHLIPVTMAPTTTYHEPTSEQAISVSRSSTVNSYENQHQYLQSTSNRSTSAYPPLANNLHPSPREPSSSSTKRVQSLQQNKAQEQSLPMSSHCHPFNRRMPISGKMKMFFGNR